MCVCFKALTKSRSLVLTLKPVNKPMSRIDMAASVVLFLYLHINKKEGGKCPDFKTTNHNKHNKQTEGADVD